MRKWVIFQSASSADHDGHFLEGFSIFNILWKGHGGGKLPKCEVIWQNWLVYGVFFQKKKFPEKIKKKIEAQYMP